MEIPTKPKCITIAGTNNQINKLPKTILGELELIYNEIVIVNTGKSNVPIILKAGNFAIDITAIDKEVEPTNLYLFIGNIIISLNLQDKKVRAEFNTIPNLNLLNISYEYAEQLLLKYNIL
jgi:hypothetical protein